MIKDDNSLIWKALTERTLDPYVPAGLEPGPEAELEDEEGPTSNLDKLIGLAAALPQEDAEGREDIDITDEAEAAKFVDEDTPL